MSARCFCGEEILRGGLLVDGDQAHTRDKCGHYQRVTIDASRAIFGRAPEVELRWRPASKISGVSA